MSHKVKHPINIPALALVGWSGSGKTTLMETLISIFSARGLRVAALKHDAHDFSIDHEGKDSWRFTAAGARRTIICSPHKLAVVEQLDQSVVMEDLLKRFSGGMDLVLVEGYKGGDIPKIEVYRPEHKDELLCMHTEQYPGILAIATDAEKENLPQLQVPILPLNESQQIADFIAQNFILKQDGVVIHEAKGRV
ncbi:MAG: molybdopterin-guanine dinucleotide biosynthesis protein B [Desulfuromonadaceae bacterium]